MCVVCVYVLHVYVYIYNIIYIWIIRIICICIYNIVYLCTYGCVCVYNIRTMGPGPGLVARVLWLYCMRLASSGVGGVRRVRLALLYVGSCVGVLWMFWMRLASSGVLCVWPVFCLIYGLGTQLLILKDFLSRVPPGYVYIKIDR